MIVSGRTFVAEDVVELELSAHDPTPLPEWTPGSHVDVVVAPNLVRQYSLCGDPSDRQTYRIAVLKTRDSRGGSAAIHSGIVIGTTIEVSSPRNTFPLASGSTSYVLAAGGIGITPILPMISALETRGEQWRLIYGGRRRSSMAYVDELSRYGDRVQIFAEDISGMVPVAAVVGEVQPDSALYVCGPEPMIAAFEQEAATRNGVAVHSERFVSAATGSSFTVRLSNQDRSIDVRHDESVLEALERQGHSPAFGCRVGVCGACVVTVVDGLVDHRDTVLSHDERRGGAMTICISRAKTPMLTLDL